MFGRQPSFGKPPGSSQENYLTKQPAGQAGFGKTPPAMPSSGLTQEYYASKTGQAQSTPQPSKGTPYSAYTPNSSSSFATNTDGVNRTYNTNTYNNADAGNFANNPTSRPPPFTQGATGLGGQQFSDPSQAFVQRDAMIDRLNTNKSQYTANSGVYQGDGPPPASFGQRPQYDFNSLMGQANDMVQQGWTNPFTQPAGGQPSGGMGPPGKNAANAQMQQYAAEQRRNAPQFPAGVSSLAWQNDPSSPLPAGWEWQRANVGSRSEGWMPAQSAGGQSAALGQSMLSRPAVNAYYPGGPGGFPAQPPEQPVFGGPAGRRPADPLSPAYDFEKVGDAGAAVMTDWYNPETGQKYSTPYGNIQPKPGTGWVRGPGPPTSSPVTPGSRPGAAQPIAPPQQGAPYAPASGPSEGATRTDPSTGKPVKYENGQWSWQPSPVSGTQPYDPSRFGDGPTQGTAPTKPQAGPAWSIPPQHRAEYSKYLESRGPRIMLYDPVRDRQAYEQWAASTGRAAGYNPGMPPNAPPSQPTSQPVWSNKLGRNLTAEEQAAYEEGNRQWAARPRPSSAEARSWLTQDRKKLTTPKPPPTTGYNPGMPAQQPVSGPARPPSQDMISYPERQFEEYQEWARQNPNQANDLLRQGQSVATTRDPFAPSRPGQPPSQTQYGTPPTSSPVPPAPPPRRMPSWHVGGSGQSPQEAELEAKTKASMASPEWQATLEASRPGRAQPIAPPEPGDPYAVGDLTKLPFYKSLMVGDTVRLNQHGQYNVFDSAGREALQYGNASQGNRLMFQRAGGRTGNTIWGSTPEGAAEQAADLKRLEERDRPIKEAAQKEGAAKIARLQELRKKQLEWSKVYGRSGNTQGILVKGRDGKYVTPRQDEYQDLINWSFKAKYDQNLTPQQRSLLEGMFGSSAEASLSPSQASALAILKKMK